MLLFFPRILRSFYFRAVATAFVILLLITLTHFLLTVFRSNVFMEERLGEEWQPLVKQLDTAYFYGFLSLGFLAFIGIAAIVDLFVVMKTARQFREVSETIVNFANGDLHLRISNTVEGPMGNLQESFNRMADTIVENIQKLEDSNRLRKELVASVAHDLGGPVTAILGFVDTIRLKADTISKDELLEYTSISRSNALFLSKLVGELSDLSRFDMDSVTLETREFDVYQLVGSVIERFIPVSEEKGVQIDFHKSRSAGKVIADPMMIERVISNLLENAVHYSDRGGNVTLSCEAVPPLMQITISDNGVGIPEEDQPYVFERFYRVDKDRSRATGGSGLGLAIVKKALDLHGVSIELKSSIGQGTEISFKLLQPDIS